MSHFSEQAWADFVRGISNAERGEMETHLASGCNDCAAERDTWKQLNAMALRESTYAPPESAVRMVKLEFSAQRLKLDATYPTPEGPHSYGVRGVPLGFGLMIGAGTLSGLLGIGSGALKVLAMDRAMHLPFKVSTTTSNFMIGVTAAASAGIYLSRGYVDPGLSMPVMLGVLAGSLVGARILMRAGVRVLRLVFSVVIVVMAAEMIYNGLTGKL